MGKFALITFVESLFHNDCRPIIVRMVFENFDTEDQVAKFLLTNTKCMTQLRELLFYEDNDGYYSKYGKFSIDGLYEHSSMESAFKSFVEFFTMSDLEIDTQKFISALDGSWNRPELDDGLCIVNTEEKMFKLLSTAGENVMEGQRDALVFTPSS